MFLRGLSCLFLCFLTVLPVSSQEVRTCGTPTIAEQIALFGEFLGDPSDCSQNLTNPTTDYDPTFFYEIPVVVHILMDNGCNQGVISDQQVASQMDVLNEDFQALVGGNGENGVNTGIRFVLADTDPDGNPATGITRDCNSTWYGDGGSYWNSLAWDPHRYLNIYTNNTSNLGYVPFLPANGGGGQVGQSNDRVVIQWTTFGRPGSSPPYDLGRTVTHEVGHYLGLNHTFAGGCSASAPPNCYSSGDLICDTWPEGSPNFSNCNEQTSCGGGTRPIHNYMDYSDDICMWEFTIEQMRRMRCTLPNYRPNLYRLKSDCDNSDLTVDAGGDPRICNGDSTQLMATITGGEGQSSVDWSPAGTLDDPSSPMPIATPTETTVYTVTVEDQSGCTSQSMVTVYVTPDDPVDYAYTWRDNSVYDNEYDLDGNGFIDIYDLVLLLVSCD